MKTQKALIGLFLSTVFLSCSNDDNKNSFIQPSSNLIEMEAEGGENEVSINNEHWRVEKIINQKNDNMIFGDIYSANGETIGENEILTLQDKGKLIADWKNKGFTIIRESLTSLRIDLKENSTGENFDFTIVINSDQGEDKNEIYVSQKPSQGYEFENIEFLLNTEDGDSIFVEKGTTRNFDLTEPQTLTFSPFKGINIQNKSHFESMEQDAFVWLENDSIEVEVPTDIHNGELFFNGEKQTYSEVWSVKPHEFEETSTISIPAGQSSFQTEIEFRKRKVSYKLNLINNRTGENKIIVGKWIQITPTGNYSVEWEN